MQRGFICGHNSHLNWLLPGKQRFINNYYVFWNIHFSQHTFFLIEFAKKVRIKVCAVITCKNLWNSMRCENTPSLAITVWYTNILSRSSQRRQSSYICFQLNGTNKPSKFVVVVVAVLEWQKTTECLAFAAGHLSQTYQPSHPTPSAIAISSGAV